MRATGGSFGSLLSTIDILKPLISNWTEESTKCLCVVIVMAFSIVFYQRALTTPIFFLISPSFSRIWSIDKLILSLSLSSLCLSSGSSSSGSRSTPAPPYFPNCYCLSSILLLFIIFLRARSSLALARQSTSC